MRFIHFFILLPLVNAISESSSPVLNAERIAANAVHTHVYRKELNSNVTIKAIVRQAEQGESIEQPRSQQPRLLFFALMRAISNRKHLAIVPLIRAGANLNGTDGDKAGRTPLMQAAIESSLTIIRKLLAHGAWPNTQNADKKTALMYAIERDRGLAIIQLLLNHGADPRIKDSRNLTALHYALRANSNQSIAIAQLLLDYEAEQIDQHGASLLNDTRITKTPLKIAWLARHGASVNNVHTGYSETLLQIARKITTPSELLQGYVLTPDHRNQRSYEQIHELVARGARLPTQGIDKINPAVLNYIKKVQGVREHIIRDLLTCAYDIPDDLQQLIGQCSDDRFGKQPPPVDVAMLRHRNEQRQPTKVYDEWKDYKTFQAVIKTLVSMAETGDYQALHTHCTDNNISSTHLFNALLHAIAKGMLTAVKTLHSAGADINGFNCSTPLRTAIIHKKVDIVQYLLAHGARPNVYSSNGSTSLHEAASLLDDRHANALIILQLLLDQGADPWIVDEYKCTALHCTFFKCDPDGQQTQKIAQFLLDHDAGDAEQVNYEGESLLDHCAFARTIDAIAWLATRGAPVNNVITGHSSALFTSAQAQSKWQIYKHERTGALPELALRGARLDPAQQDKISPALLSIITNAQQERCNAITEALSPLHETSSAQRLIRQFSDDITTTQQPEN